MKDYKVEGSDYIISLKKMMGEIEDVQGFVTNEVGEPTFEISRVVLKDGTMISTGGEHDYPYLENDRLDEMVREIDEEDL